MNFYLQHFDRYRFINFKDLSQNFFLYYSQLENNCFLIVLDLKKYILHDDVVNNHRLFDDDIFMSIDY